VTGICLQAIQDAPEHTFQGRQLLDDVKKTTTIAQLLDLVLLGWGADPRRARHSGFIVKFLANVSIATSFRQR
jgi:hypothetical protein